MNLGVKITNVSRSLFCLYSLHSWVTLGKFLNGPCLNVCICKMRITKPFASELPCENGMHVQTAQDRVCTQWAWHLLVLLSVITNKRKQRKGCEAYRPGLKIRKILLSAFDLQDLGGWLSVWKAYPSTNALSYPPTPASTPLFLVHIPAPSNPPSQPPSPPLWLPCEHQTQMHTPQQKDRKYREPSIWKLKHENTREHLKTETAVAQKCWTAGLPYKLGKAEKVPPIKLPLLNSGPASPGQREGSRGIFAVYGTSAFSPPHSLSAGR